MLVRYAGARKKPNAATPEPVAAELDPEQADQKAALVIQSCWRGFRDTQDFEQRRCRSKPWGYYTHSLALTFVSSRETKSFARMLHLLLEDPSSSQTAQALSIFIVGVIVLSVAGFILETVQEVKHASPTAWLALEVICTVIFTAEYLCRLSVCNHDPAAMSRFRFVTSPMNVFDLAAVLPFYIEVVLASAGLHEESALRALRVVRLVRVLRMFKLGRYASGLRLMGQALKNSSQAISVLIFLTLVGVALFSSFLFSVEQLGCPDRRDMAAEELVTYVQQCADPFYRGVSEHGHLCCIYVSEGLSVPVDFPSIIAASWWSMVTMTSVGYGEVYPKTTLGKCVGCVAMLAGMVLIALPVAIMGQKFQDVYETHDLVEAKFRGQARMRVQGEMWSLVPASDVCSRLRHLTIEDPILADALSGFTKHLEEVWEQREQTARGRKLELEKQEQIRLRISEFLNTMEPVFHACRMEMEKASAEAPT